MQSRRDGPRIGGRRRPSYRKRRLTTISSPPARGGSSSGFDSIRFRLYTVGGASEPFRERLTSLRFAQSVSPPAMEIARRRVIPRVIFTFPGLLASPFTKQ